MLQYHVKIFISHHKPYWTCETGIITPIQVGRALAEEWLPMLGDDMGTDQISAENRQFCELTAMYWAWKNIKLDSIGFGHYRRYFCFSDKIPGRLVDKPFPVIELLQPDTMSAEQISKFAICEDAVIREFACQYDIVVPEPVTFIKTVEEQYKTYHLGADWDTMLAVLLEKYPDYQDDMQRIFRANRSLFPYNMFIMRFDLFCEYMEWLFTILFELKHRIKINSDAYQQRVFGFLAERLLTLFIVHKNKGNKLKIRTLKTVMLE